MNLPVAPLVALFLGGAAAAGVAVMPAPALEGLVMDSGLPAILSAAEPPLGLTAKLALAGGTGVAVALVVWFFLFILLGTRGLSVGKEAPVRVRRADAHPDAPPRAPLLATRDLGTPFLEVTAARPDAEAIEPLFTQTQTQAPVHVVADEVAAEPVAPPEEQPLPVDLQQPLSAYDPGAILDTPMPPPVQIAPLRRAPRPQVFDAGERFETFELTPPVRNTPPPAPRPRDEAMTRPDTEATIHALLERLERGVVKKGLTGPAQQTPREAERGLEDALVTLRNLARRA
jgi:hypothetical protein